jgi:hypothetical protein
MALGAAVFAMALFGGCGSDSSGSEDGELQEATEVVRDFYLARSSGDGAVACSHISQELLKKLEGLAANTEAKGCAAFLEAFTSLSDAERREMTTFDAVGFRRAGEQAFLVYRGAGDEIHEMPLVEEDGEWKVAELSAPAVD